MQIEHYQNIVCIQIRRDERANLVHQLVRLEQEGGAAPMPTLTGTVTCVLSDGLFRADCTDLTNVVLTLPPPDLRCLIEAIEEHIRGGDEFPLDHSFEPQGATMVPNSIRDVVLETID